jgi:hypothetical protein
MKKSHDARQPLNMLKIKLGIKRQTEEAFQVFETELTNILIEQEKFVTALEYKVATAESTDKIQVSIVSISLFHRDPA